MERTHIFNSIETGMPVIQESDKEKVGTVEFIRFGEGAEVGELPEVDTLVEILAEAFTANDRFPDEVYQKLYAEGFLKVDRGLKPDAFVLPSQIAHVVDGEVHTSVDEDELLNE